MAVVLLWLGLVETSAVNLVSPHSISVSLKSWGCKSLLRFFVGHRRRQQINKCSLFGSVIWTGKGRAKMPRISVNVYTLNGGHLELSFGTAAPTIRDVPHGLDDQFACIQGDLLSFSCLFLPLISVNALTSRDTCKPRKESIFEHLGVPTAAQTLILAEMEGPRLVFDSERLLQLGLSTRSCGWMYVYIQHVFV